MDLLERRVSRRATWCLVSREYIEADTKVQRDNERASKPLFLIIINTKERKRKTDISAKVISEVFKSAFYTIIELTLVSGKTLSLSFRPATRARYSIDNRIILPISSMWHNLFRIIREKLQFSNNYSYSIISIIYEYLHLSPCRRKTQLPAGGEQSFSAMEVQ